MKLINWWRFAGWGLAGLLLALPAVAMRFTDEVNWSAADFVFAAAMFGGVGFAIEAAARRSSNFFYRAGALAALAAVFLLVWIDAAVGIVGEATDPRNIAFLCVIVVALAGAVFARCRATGLARAMTAASVVQMLVGVFAAIMGGNEPPGAVDQLVLSGGFALMFVASALLFRRAAADSASD